MELAVTLPALVVVLALLSGAEGRLRPSSTIQGDEGKPLRKAELLVFDSKTAPGIEVGVHIVLEPGWYTYWTNPGDAGLAPGFTWHLPAGFKAGAPRYPVPEVIRYGNLVVYGHHGEVLILTAIAADRPVGAGEVVQLALDLDWMACKESCLAGREALTASPATLDQAGRDRARDIRARFSDRYPKPADQALLAGVTAVAAKTPRGWTVELSFPGARAARVRDFYPHPVAGFVIDHSRIGVSGGKVRIPLTPSTASASIDSISGLLILDSTGYEIKLPVRSGMDSPR